MGKSIKWKMDSCGKAAIIYSEGEQYALSQVVNGYYEQKQRIEKLEGERKKLRGFIADLQQLASETTSLSNDAVERWCKQTLEDG